jgi:integrase
MTDEPDKAAQPEAEPKKKPKTRRVGQVLERGENKWLIRIFRGYKPNGQNDYFNKTFHGPKKEAERWLRGALARRDRGEPLEDPDITFESLFNEWLEGKKKKRKKRTVEIYQNNFKYYVKKAFAVARISSITSRDVQKWINELVDEDYDSDTVHMAYSAFRGPIQYALDHGMLLKNPMQGVELPKKEKRKANVMEPEEALKVLEVARDEPMGVFVAFLLWSGTRPNEAAALQWKDVDWKKESIQIRRNVVRLDNGKSWEFDDTKTESGNRSFTMPASFMAWLKEHRQAQLEQRMRLGRDWYDYDLVFTDDVGEPLSRSAYKWLWIKILTKAGLSEERTKMRTYDARHTMATLLLWERTPIKVVTARMGHARTSITEDIYSHVLDRMQAQATDDLERAIFGAKKGSNKE